MIRSPRNIAPALLLAALLLPFLPPPAAAGALRLASPAGRAPADLMTVFTRRSGIETDHDFYQGRAGLAEILAGLGAGYLPENPGGNPGENLGGNLGGADGLRQNGRENSGGAEEIVYGDFFTRGRDTAEEIVYGDFFTRGEPARSPYDILVIPSGELAGLAAAGRLTKLQPSRLGRLSALDRRLAVLGQNEAGEVFGVPYLWDSLGLGWNRQAARGAGRRVRANNVSWGVIFDPERAGDFAQCGIGLSNRPEDLFAFAGFYLDLPEGEDLLIRAQEAFLAILPYVKGFYSPQEAAQALAAGDLCLAMTSAAAMHSARQQGGGEEVELSYALPLEGALIWADIAVIPAGAEEEQAAYRWLNYILQPDIAASIANASDHASAVRDSRPYLNLAGAGNDWLYPAARLLARARAQKAWQPENAFARARSFARLQRALFWDRDPMNHP